MQDTAILNACAIADVNAIHICPYRYLWPYRGIIPQGQLPQDNGAWMDPDTLTQFWGITVKSAGLFILHYLHNLNLTFNEKQKYAGL